MRLKNKVAIVTGSGRGIGKAIALEFAKEGAKVVVNCLHEEHAKEVVNEIKQIGGDAIFICADVSNKEQIENLVNKTVEKFGKIDILVNNAGVVDFENFLEMKEETWDRVMKIDLKGTFLCSQTVAKHMVKQKYGKIINIASIAGFVGFSRLAHYCSAKAGVIQFTKEISIELAPYKINVNCIAPGIIETDMTKPLMKDPKIKQSFLAAIPMARIGKPKEIASVAVFLASDESNYMTGSTVFVDGGWTVQ